MTVLGQLRRVTSRAVVLAAAASAYRSGDRFGRKSIVAPTDLPVEKPGDLERYFDGNTDGPGIWKWRHYFPIYERHLGRFVGQRPRILEIGIYSGGSLQMWHEYFGAGTSLLGVDIEPDCQVYATDGTTVMIGDQADPAFLKDIVARTPDGFDIVIDDGGHEAHQQIASFEGLINHVRPNGVYLCEDVHQSDQAFHAYVAGLARTMHATDGFDMAARPVQRAVYSITTYPFMVVIEKTGADRSRLTAPKRGTEWQPFYAP